MRWAAKVDANQKEIVQALRDAYCSVLPLHRVGQGAPDLAVGYGGHTYFLEIKTDKGKLTPAEKKFMEQWRGHYVIVRTVDEALKAIGLEEIKPFSGKIESVRLYDHPLTNEEIGGDG